MRRRVFLTAIGTLSAGFAGCLGVEEESTESGAENEDDGYHECHAPYVKYGALPDEIRSEVNVAFEKGVYETDEKPLYDQAVGETTPLFKGDNYYNYYVERDGETQQLSFEEKTGYTSPRRLSITSTKDDEVTVSAGVTDEDGEVILNEKEIVVDRENSTLLELTGEFGTYEIEIETDDQNETDTFSLRYGSSETGEISATIDDDSISISTLELAGDYYPCSQQWER